MTHVSRPGHRRTSCTTVDFQDQVQITYAMHLLQSGTDLAVIALWLGHSSPTVTHQYLEADLAAKEAVLQKLTDPSPAPARFHADDRLLTFLNTL